jgi:hypothetical protein
MHQHDAALPPIDGPWIEIRGGRTRFPRRPIHGDRLLIGSGSNCHLQLGGGMPMAHSVISLDSEGWSIEALSSEPKLMVAGAVVRRAALHDGDLIQVGPFTLVAHLTAVAQNELMAPIDIAATLALVGTPEPQVFADTLEEMSAEELVDNLTSELTRSILADRGASAADDIVRHAAAAEVDAIDEEQLVAEVMAQLAEMSERLAARDTAGEAVLPLPIREQPTENAPLRKSA